MLSMGIFSWAQENNTITETALVRGNCQMCKSNIENAIRMEPSAEGTWDIPTKVLTVSFDPSKTSLNKILKRVAEMGYDNQEYTADDETYNNLAGCCHYDREQPWETIIHSEGTHLPDSEEQDERHDHKEHSTENNNTDENYDWENGDNTIQLKSIKADGNKAATSLDRKSADLTFNINEGELLKAACCNLSESFETNATVDVNYANAVTGAKQIKMLGLNQKYTLITKELLPDIRGLSTPYGLNFIPGRWISAIQLTKGGSTVTNGYESITGQINTELFKTHSKRKTILNFYGNLQSRVEANFVHADTLNSKWSQSILTHGNALLKRNDSNDDGFMDQPVGKQLNIAYLLDYNDLDKSGLGTHFGVNYLIDSRLGGQMDFNEQTDRFSTKNYGVGIDINRFNFWNKTGYVFKGKPYQSIGFMNQFTYYEQNSYFGLTPYNGNQKTYYGNLIFESILGSSFHKYKTGASFLYDVYNEQYKTQNYERTETVPGLFFEYTYLGEKFTAVAGIRTDFHNLAGTQFSPRLNIKYDLFEKTTLRASAGRGFRTPNVFAESQPYLASNRTIEIRDDQGDIYGLDAEEAWNYGVNISQEFKLFHRSSTLLVDFFRTDFQNQILPDLDASTHSILYYNIEGDSYANSFQVQWDLEPIKRLELRLAYKNYKTQANYESGKNSIPFTPSNRGFMNVAYSTFKKSNGQQWSFDTTVQWVGKQRIPNTSENPVEFQLPSESDSYFLWNAQIARQMNKRIRLYAGVENLLGYTQDNPIVDAQNPFGDYFDGGMIYAPIQPANLYFGLDVEF